MKKSSFSFFCLLSLPLQLWAQTSIGSLDEATALALKGNRDMLVARSTREADKAQARNAVSVLMPQVKLLSTLDYNYALPVQLIPAEFLGGQPGEYKKVQFGTKYNFTSGVEASMPLVNAAAWWDARIASVNKAISDNQLVNREYEVSLQVARGYFYTLAARDALKLSRLNLGAADSMLHIVEVKKQNGMADPLEENRIRTAWLQARNAVEQNQSVYTRNINQLKQQMGMQVSEELLINDSLERYASLPPVERKAGTVQPLLTLYQLQSRASGYMLQRERFKRLPEISLYGRYSVQNQRNDLSFFSPSASWFNIGVVGLRLEMPLFTGLARNNIIYRADQRLSVARFELEKEINRQAAEDIDLQTTFTSNYNQLGQSSEAYRLSRESVRVGLLRYEQGIMTPDQYLVLYQEMLNAQNQYIRNLSETAVSRMLISIKNQY